MSSTLDLLIRGAEIITPDGIFRQDAGISEGRFVEMAKDITTPASEVIEATGLSLFPGILDAHVHFNEPGREDWEGLTSGSSALAAGGGTWFADMPLNSSPPVTDAATFAAKRAVAEQKSLTDFSLWGGLVPGNLDRLEEMCEAGAMGFKAFLCGSGLDEFPGITDPATLREGMQRAAALGMLVAVHAEDEATVRRLTAIQRTKGMDARSWLDSRPPEAELTAIRMATELAGETGCALHIVHVSTPEGLALIREAKRMGVNVSAETCPHYLLLTEDDVLRQGAPAKCAPPLRPEEARRELWTHMESGSVDTIGSDHSPAPPDMKTGEDFFGIWGGISGCQHGFALLLSEGGNSLPQLAAMLAANVAERFRLPHKGRIVIGCDADFALWDLHADRVLTNEELLCRHRQGPYAGRHCRAQVRQTFVRGRRIFADGGIAPQALPGKFIPPTR